MFPIPQEPSDASQHTQQQKRLLQKLLALQKVDQLNPQNNQDSLDQFLSTFDWTDSTLDKQTRQDLDESPGGSLDFFAKHRFDTGININVKAKLTPIDESPGYSQDLPTSNNLKEDITLDSTVLLN